MLRHFHELAKLFCTHRKGIALRVFKDQEMTEVSVCVERRTHRVLVSGGTVTRNVQHCGFLAYGLLKMLLGGHFTLKVDLAARFIESLLDRLSFSQEVQGWYK